MSKLKLSGEHGSAIIRWSCDGDYHVRIKVNVAGYSGHADGHVHEEEFKAFAANVCRVAQVRKGEARLGSIIPEIFDISIEPVDSVGHFALVGRLGFTVGWDPEYKQALQFNLEFEPSLLDEAEKVLGAEIET